MKSLLGLLLALVIPTSGWAQAPLSPRSGANTLESGIDIFRSGYSAISEGSRRLGEVATTSGRASAVLAAPVTPHDTILIGLGTQWLEFDAPAASLVPPELKSVAAKLGWNHAFDSQWSFRFEADPGVYGAGSFGAPMALRAIYAVDRDLQWAFGVNYDWRSGTPLLGGVGVRWHFAPAWTLAFLLPNPRLEWAIGRNLTLTLGASLRGGTFRVADDFGRTRGRPAFDGQTVDYREISVGAGARWQFSRQTTLSLGVGATTDRRFAFDGRNLLLNGKGAPAAQLTFTSSY